MCATVPVPDAFRLRTKRRSQAHADAPPQGDRRDGLSGSLSNTGASDVGWASALDPSQLLPNQPKKGVVVDRPPGLPDVFNLAPTLRKARTRECTHKKRAPDSVRLQRTVTHAQSHNRLCLFLYFLSIF